MPVLVDKINLSEVSVPDDRDDIERVANEGSIASQQDVLGKPAHTRPATRQVHEPQNPLLLVQQINDDFLCAQGKIWWSVTSTCPTEEDDGLFLLDGRFGDWAFKRRTVRVFAMFP